MANEFLANGLQDVQRLAYDTAIQQPCITKYDFVTPYVADLASVIDMEAIRAAGVKIGIDPLGGGCWLLAAYC